MIVAIQIIFGLISQILVLRLIGAGDSTDSLVAAQSIVAVIFSLLATMLQSIWQSKMSQVSKNHDYWMSNMSLSLGQSLILCILTLVPISIASKFIINLIFPDLNPLNIQLSSNIIVILAIMSTFSLMSSQITICLRAIDQFVLPELINLALSIMTVIVLIEVLPKYGVISVVWTSLVRAIITFSILYIISGRPNFDIRRAIRKKEIWQSILHILSSNALSKLSPLVDRYFIAQSGSGTLTIFNFAVIAAGAISTIIEKGMSTPLSSKIGLLVMENNHKKIIEIIKKAIFRILIVCSVIFICNIIMNNYIAELIYRILKLNENENKLLVNIELLLFGYIFASAAGPIIVSAIFSYNFHKIYLNISIIGFIIGIFYKYYGYKLYGAYGLTFSISLYYITNMYMLYYFINKNKSNK